MSARLFEASTASDCVHCGHPFGVHKRHDAPADVAVYVPCTVCECSGWSDSDPWADDPYEMYGPDDRLPTGEVRRQKDSR